MDAMATVVSSLADIDWPFLILHSEIDELTSVEGSKLMYEKAKSKDKYLKVGNTVSQIGITCSQCHIGCDILSSHNAIHPHGHSSQAVQVF